MPITGDVRDQNMTPVLGINCVKKKITCLFFFPSALSSEKNTLQLCTLTYIFEFKTIL